MYASFYLGLLLDAEGEGEKARAYFEKVIQLDPMSNFGKFSYIRLGA